MNDNLILELQVKIARNQNEIDNIDKYKLSRNKTMHIGSRKKKFFFKWPCHSDKKIDFGNW